MQSHTVKEWLGLLWETFQPQWRPLDEWEQQCKGLTRGQDLNTVVQKFRGQSYDQVKLRYLKAEVRRRALRGFWNSVLSANWQSNQKDLDHFEDRPPTKIASCCFPPVNFSNSPNIY